MRKILVTFIFALLYVMANAQVDTLSINEITVVSFYRNSVDAGSVVEKDDLVRDNYGHPSIVTFTRVWSRPLILKYPYPKSVPLSEREIIDGISANKCDGSCP